MRSARPHPNPHPARLAPRERRASDAAVPMRPCPKFARCATGVTVAPAGSGYTADVFIPARPAQAAPLFTRAGAQGSNHHAMLPRSLTARLWLTIAIAVVPVFLFAFVDYMERRQTALDDVRGEIASHVTAARQDARAAHQSVVQLLSIMARAAELETLDGRECSPLAQRLLDSLEGYANIGAALPDGTVFCSARPQPRLVKVADRAWFRNAIEHGGTSPGEFIIGRITGAPVVVFGHRLESPEGEVRAVVFASTTLDWLDRLVGDFSLPAGWEAMAISANGRVLSHKPDPARWRDALVPTAMLERLAALADGPGVAQLEGADGVPRLVGVLTPEFAPGAGFISISAPIERSLDAVNRRLLLNLALILVVALGSGLVARLFIHRLVEVWAARVRAVVARIAAGGFDARVGYTSGVRDLDELSEGIEGMAAEL